MAEIVLVLGNGFDLDLGLKSKYIDFAESDEWYELYNTYRKRLWRNNSDESLLLKIENEKFSNWFDLEEIIYSFVNAQTYSNKSVINLNKTDFDDLREKLKNYLIRISKEYTTKTDSLSFNLLQALVSNNNCSKNISSFNYTDCLTLCKLKDYALRLHNKHHEDLEYTHIHGSLNEGIVLGCEVYNGNIINKDYSFLYKYNMLKKPNRIVKNLLEAKEVIFFGHSINEMDFCYFRDYFKIMSTTDGRDKNLTIICKDEKSEIDIKDNIRSQGVIVTDLYNNLNIIDFFHTDLIYDNGNEAIKWNEFLDRIRRFNASSRGVNYR